MAVETTPLGFQKPDGNEPIRNGDNAISTNAQKAQDLLTEARANIANLLSASGFSGDPLELNDAAVSQAITVGPVSKTTLFDAIADRARTFTLTSDAYPGLDDTGSTDATAAILAIADAAPWGSTLKMPGQYNLSTNLVLPAKNLVLDCTGGEFILKSAGTNILCAGAFDSQISMSALTTASITMDGNVVTDVAKLTASSTFTGGWVRGDLIKVISDDVIPAAHVTSPTNKPRVGEFATVYEVIGDDIYLSGPLREGEYLTTNIRAARLPKASITVVSPSARVEDASIASRQTINFFRFQNLVYPKVLGWDVKQLTGMGLSFKSCFGYRVESGMTHYNTDDTANGVVGYSVHDSSCNFGEIIGGVFMGGRHSFTDGSGDLPTGSTDTSSHGASIGMKVIGAKALFMKHAGFDTHHQSLNAEFINCLVYAVPGGPAFLLRGRKHRVVNPIVFGGREVLYVTTQVTGSYSEGESYGHELINFSADGTERIITDARRSTATHPNYNVKDDRATRITGGRITGNKRLFVLVNSAVHVTGPIESELGPVIDAGNIINLTNSNLLGMASVRVDASLVATLGVNNWLINCDDSASLHSTVRLDKLSLKSSAAYAAGMTSGPITINSNTEEFTIRDLLFENYPWTTSTPIDATDTNLGVQNISYRVLSDSSSGTQPATRSSAWLSKSNSSLTTTMRNLFRSTDMTLTLALTINDSTSRQLIALPAGKFSGQRLTILLSSVNGGASVTVKNGATGNIDLTGGVDKVLNASGQSITAVFALTRWVQIG